MSSGSFRSDVAGTDALRDFSLNLQSQKHGVQSKNQIHHVIIDLQVQFTIKQQ